MNNTDPRSKNVWFDATTPGHYLHQYAEAVKNAVLKVDQKALETACSAIAKSTAAGGHVYVAGNGGSAAIADHLCCDFTKGTYFPGQTPIRSISLAANSSVLTALGNDFGYEETFSFQVETLMKKGDVLIVISSSGNSENILRAVRAAQKMGLTTIGMAGFGGGALIKEAQIALHVPFENYGIVEDAHQMLMHVMSQYITLNREKNPF